MRKLMSSDCRSQAQDSAHATAAPLVMYLGVLGSKGTTKVDSRHTSSHCFVSKDREHFVILIT